MRSVLRFFLTLFALALAMIGCGRPGAPPAPPAPLAPADVSLHVPGMH